MSSNPYLEQICVNLPRLLALFDRDRTSLSYGIGDRYHWAWGLIDFGNGTFQGAAHGLARLWSAGLWPYPTTRSVFLERIDAMIEAASKLTRRDGSLEEAFPHEGSYCVTALVAFDLLCALDLLDEEITPVRREHWEASIRPMLRYLIRADETHALISNHLATAVAALARWHRRTGDMQAELKAKDLLARILAHQSVEGWFCEYQGADPGYQSLCTYYLADVHLLRPDWQLLEPLRASISFLQYFAHPDGSFGGIYGSRCTRFYYPAGVLALAPDIPEAAALALFMGASVAKERTVTLSAIDEPNLIPMFNAYAWAAVECSHAERLTPKSIPAIEKVCFRRFYPEAGLLIDRGLSHYSIISTHTGGVVYHFSDNYPSPLIDAGIVVIDPHRRYGSTQGYSRDNVVKLSQDEISITADITAMPKQWPSPLQFVVIRLLSLTAFRSSIFREWIKGRLVNMLITRRQVWPISNRRCIRLGSSLSIEDRPNTKPGFSVLHDPGPFVAIHMASQGYWQIQDEHPA